MFFYLWGVKCLHTMTHLTYALKARAFFSVFFSYREEYKETILDFN